MHLLSYLNCNNNSLRAERGRERALGGVGWGGGGGVSATAPLMFAGNKENLGKGSFLKKVSIFLKIDIFDQ